MLDLIEIDAASNNSVDDVRELREKVGFQPSESRYKVYIIDEVHMLSASAFNALLKTLEEPPPYARFVLATTEPHRIPATVLSRCQRFDFRRIPRCRDRSPPDTHRWRRGLRSARVGNLRNCPQRARLYEGRRQPARSDDQLRRGRVGR